ALFAMRRTPRPRVSGRTETDRRALLHERRRAEIRAEVAVIILSNSAAALVGYARRYGEIRYPISVPARRRAQSNRAACSIRLELFNRRDDRVGANTASRRRRLGR